ncbi:hypothetical protein T10_10109 [Trichinella papuae]|uniref:Uncharacterized protein n=1 Tax=Trichinella papuae TaxID=268474 RepID=A0A0V1MFE9_9BILA|nr:hypothetical protein T10_10109 [Trichinella papuae]
MQSLEYVPNSLDRPEYGLTFLPLNETLHIIPKASEDALPGAPYPLPSKLYTCLKLQFGAVFQSTRREKIVIPFIAELDTSDSAITKPTFTPITLYDSRETIVPLRQLIPAYEKSVIEETSSGDLLIKGEVCNREDQYGTENECKGARFIKWSKNTALGDVLDGVYWLPL